MKTLEALPLAQDEFMDGVAEAIKRQKEKYEVPYFRQTSDGRQELKNPPDISKELNGCVGNTDGI